MATPFSLLYNLNPPPLHTLTKLPPTAAATATRRSFILLTTSLLISTQTKSAAAFDFRMTVPEQSLEQAEAGIESHAQSLIEVKDLLTAELWREAQKELRKSSALLKQDVYTIINQAKSKEERPRLRKLYTELFSAVRKLDYAARDKDRIKVWELYDTIILSLRRILSQL